MTVTPEVIAPSGSVDTKREPWWPLAWNVHGDNSAFMRSVRVMMPDGDELAITHMQPIAAHDPPYRIWRARPGEASIPVGIAFDEIDVRCTLLEEAYPGSMPYGGVA